MSTTANSLDVAALDKQLNDHILAGKALEAFDALYADDVVMQENSEAPRHGKELNRKFEVDFFASIEQFHGAKLVGSAVTGDRSYSEWEWDLTFKGGQRVQLAQVAARVWKNGKLAHERFYYSKG